MREAVYMGRSQLCTWSIRRVWQKVKKVWSAKLYHLTQCNCITFAEALLRELCVPRPFPAWVRGVCSVVQGSPRQRAVVDHLLRVGDWVVARQKLREGNGEEEVGGRELLADGTVSAAAAARPPLPAASWWRSADTSAAKGAYARAR